MGYDTGTDYRKLDNGKLDNELFSDAEGEGKINNYLRRLGLGLAFTAALLFPSYKDTYKEQEYRPRLEVVVTNEYTHPSAWAHTLPEEKRICIRPPEFIDYRLTFRRVLGHEIGHNVRHIYGLPDDDEDHHTRNAYQHLANSPFELRSSYTLS